jgi:FkbM family methyltransferase
MPLRIMTHPVPARQRIRSKVRREAKRLQLNARHAVRGDFAVDYGWIRLPYTADGDLQDIYYHLNHQPWYEKDSTIFRSLLYPGATAIDVGANVGFVSAILASLVGETGRVVALEPASHTFTKLLTTLSVNRLDNVIPLKVGCGSVRKSRALHDVTASSGNASILGAGPVLDTISLVPLDEIPEVWETPVTLIKIDTEGFEPEVLEGGRRLISEFQPILYLEMGGDYPDSTRRSIAVLREFGYDTRAVETMDWSTIGNGSDFFFFPAAPPERLAEPPRP